MSRSARKVRKDREEEEEGPCGTFCGFFPFSDFDNEKRLMVAFAFDYS